MDLLLRRRMMMAQGGGGPVPPASDGKIWAYYDVNDTENATTILSGTSGIGATMEVDGVAIARAQTYLFTTEGEHLIKFTPTSTTLERNVFSHLQRLKELYLPEGILKTNGANSSVLSIGDNAILEKVVLPSTLTTLGGTDFYNMPALKYVNLEYITASPNGQNFQSAGTAFLEVNLASFTGSLHRPFMQSGLGKVLSLGSITILSGGVNTNVAPFVNCPNLTEVTLPATLTEISTCSFYNCPNLTKLTVEATTPPTLAANVLRGTTNLTAIYVPAASVAAYQADTSWSYWAGIIQAIP